VARYGTFSNYQIGPGPMGPAVTALLVSNVAMWLLALLVPQMTLRLGLAPRDVFEHGALWQPVTYMFLHDTGGLSHLLFNMLSLWMFGTELERTWGTRSFVRYYLTTGIGAALLTLAVSLAVPSLYFTLTVGASGAIYGLLLAWALQFPHRSIYLYFVFPVPARIFVLVAGALAFFSSLGGPGGSVAHLAHLGGLIVGYAALRTRRLRLRDLWTQWRRGRARSRFDVYNGGRAPRRDDWTQDWKKHIH